LTRAEQLAAVAPPCEPRAITAGVVAHGTELRAALRLAGVERRIDVDEVDRLVGKLREHGQVIGEHDAVHGRRRLHT
jgi:hypothetical protein